MYHAGRAKTQFVSTYLKGRIAQWGRRRGEWCFFADHIAIVLVTFKRQKKSHRAMGGCVGGDGLWLSLALAIPSFLHWYEGSLFMCNGIGILIGNR